MKYGRIFKAGSVLFLLSQSVSASDAAQIIADTICMLIPEAIQLAWALALLMFVYGGAKYAYSADDPGGRKQGKNIAVNALIGFIIVGAAEAVILAINNNTPIC
jgi:hypothetical protein